MVNDVPVFFFPGLGPNGEKLMRDDAMKHQIVKSRGQPEMSLTLRGIEGFVVAIDINHVMLFPMDPITV